MPSVKLYAKSILRDIQQGLGDVPIMEKYQITPSEYMSVLEQFKHIGIARKRRALVAQSVSHDLPHMRALPRCYIFREVCVFDAKAPGKEGKVNDMTENGVQLANSLKCLPPRKPITGILSSPGLFCGLPKKNMSLVATV